MEGLLKEKMETSNITPIISMTIWMSSIYFALSVNLFFRKSFVFRLHGSFLLVLLALASCTGYCEKIAVLQSIRSQTFHGLLKSLGEWDVQDILNVFCTCGLVLYYHHDQTMTLFRWYWCSIPLLSLFQLIRNPAILREFLRPIRVGLGPPSIINASWICWLEIWYQPTVFNIKTLLSVCCLLTTLSAGIVFRPDNIEVLEMFLPYDNIFGMFLPYTSKYPKRKEFHAILNICSVILAIAMLMIKKEISFLPQ